MRSGFHRHFHLTCGAARSFDENGCQVILLRGARSEAEYRIVDFGNDFFRREVREFPHRIGQPVESE